MRDETYKTRGRFLGFHCLGFRDIPVIGLLFVHTMTTRPEQEGLDYNKGLRDGYAAGLAAGQRKERRALKRWAAGQAKKYLHDYANLRRWLASRAKKRGREG